MENGVLQKRDRVTLVILLQFRLMCIEMLNKITKKPNFQKIKTRIFLNAYNRQVSVITFFSATNGRTRIFSKHLIKWPTILFLNTVGYKLLNESLITPTVKSLLAHATKNNIIGLPITFLRPIIDYNWPTKL